ELPRSSQRGGNHAGCGGGRSASLAWARTAVCGPSRAQLDTARIARTIGRAYGALAAGTTPRLTDAASGPHTAIAHAPEPRGTAGRFVCDRCDDFADGGADVLHRANRQAEGMG